MLIALNTTFMITTTPSIASLNYMTNISWAFFVCWKNPLISCTSIHNYRNQNYTDYSSTRQKNKKKKTVTRRKVPHWLKPPQIAPVLASSNSHIAYSKRLFLSFSSLFPFFLFEPRAASPHLRPINISLLLFNPLAIHRHRIKRQRQRQSSNWSIDGISS